MNRYSTLPLLLTPGVAFTMYISTIDATKEAARVFDVDTAIDPKL